jgi:DNA modification methylase
MLINDDCRKAIKNIPDNSIDLIIADPPYVGLINKDWDKENVFTKDLCIDLFRVLKSTGSIYVFCGIGEFSNSLFDFYKTLQETNFIYRDIITWKKQRGMGAKRGWLYTREEILWFVKSKDEYIWNEEFQYSKELRKDSPGGIEKYGSKFKRLTNVWTDINETLYEEGKSPRQRGMDRIHPTQKPEKLIERIILAHTKKGDTILDPFSGSGVTGIVCESLERNYILIEEDPDMFLQAKNRIDQYKNLLF